MNLEDKSIRFLQTIERNTNDLYLGFSGGKDSVVIYDLALRAGIKFTAVYSNTTIDPPGTISFIRKHYPSVQILQPLESFYDLVRRKGLPTRQTRFCCEYLKERAAIGRTSIVGVRSSESHKREGRDYTHCDTRKNMKGAKYIYPIYDWQDDDVWNYIHKYQLPIAPCYTDGCERLGCVGCPLIYPRKKAFEFSIYPKIYKTIRNAIEEGMRNNPQWKISVATEGDAELAMQWWISNKSINQYFPQYTFTKGKRGWTKVLI